MSNVQKLHDFYSIKPDAGIFQSEFGFYVLDKWKEQGHINDDTNLVKLFGYDAGAHHWLWQLGWCESAFYPKFEKKILEDLGKYELVQDSAGRAVLYFKGRRDGFMPEYKDHPVKDMKTWGSDVKWRLSPDTPERYTTLVERMNEAKEGENEGNIICQPIIGGYMYLRSLMGPEGVCICFTMIPI